MDLSDVDLSTKDKRRITYLTDRDFSETEAEAIVKFARLDRSDRDPDNIRSYVKGDDFDPDVVDGLTTDDCDTIRRRMDRADTTADVVDDYPDKHPSVIFRHATGECEHDATVDATTTPRIQRDECKELRKAIQSGDTVEDIRHDFHRSSNAIVRHAFGRCDHDFPNFHGRPAIGRNDCRNMRRTYRENDSASVTDVARAFLIGTGTAHRHLTGDCGHDHDDEPPIDTDGAEPIDADECDRLRDGYRGGYTPDELADDFDREVSSVRTHVFGRCRHDGDGCDPRNERVSPTRCKALRYEYKNRGTRSVKSIIDDHDGITKGTFYYHTFGDCSHDVDVAPADREGH